MDLIYTDANRVDQGVLAAHALDLSYGASENDFTLTVSADETPLEYGAIIYIEGTEYGGIIDGAETSTNGDTVTYFGRTWHGVLNSKIIEPYAGENYYIASGDVVFVVDTLIYDLTLGGLFYTTWDASGVAVNNYKFKRYCAGYDGIRDMLTSAGAKLLISWNAQARKVQLDCVPAVDYSRNPVDGDMAQLKVKQNAQKVNHLICLGKGELAAREVIHLYADAGGNIVDTQTYSGIDEVAATYDNTNSEDLRADGIKRFKELRSTDKAEIDVAETDSLFYDIGDIVGATEIRTGISANAHVTQKIVRINNGVASVEYKTGG